MTGEDSGYSSAFLRALGRDCSGLANPTRVYASREADPRFCRTMLKVTEICRPASGGAWEKVESEDLVMGVSGDGT